MPKISRVSFLIGRLMYWERIKVIISQGDPYDKTGDAIKGGRGCNICLLYLSVIIQLFSLVRVLSHQHSITNHSKSILSPKS